MWNKRYEVIEEYTLNELIHEADPSITLDKIVAKTKTIVDVYKASPAFANETASAEVIEAWRRIAVRCWAQPVANAVGEPTYTAIVGKLFVLLEDTEAKYKPILDAYATAIAKTDGMLSGIASSSTNRRWYNDTPQVKSPDEDDLQHLTDYTKTGDEAVTDGATPMARIAELQASMASVYRTWENEIISAMMWEH